MEQSLLLNFLTPHGKWQHPLDLQRQPPHAHPLPRHRALLDLNEKDAARIGVADNDWVEVYNDNGVMVTRAAVSSRGPAGHVHGLPRAGAHLSAQVAVARESAGAGGHNSLTRAADQSGAAGGRLRPVHLFLQLLGPHRLQPRHLRDCVRKLERPDW